jgi:hypothetical protein
VTSASGADGLGCASRLARDNLAFSLLEGLEEFRRPGGGVGTLDPGTGQKVVQWYLGGSCVGQKSLVEVEYSRKSTDLTGCL